MTSVLLGGQLIDGIPFYDFTNTLLGPVARSLVSANRWLRGIKMYRFPWYLTLVSINYASSNPGPGVKGKTLIMRVDKSVELRVICV